MFLVWWSCGFPALQRLNHPFQAGCMKRQGGTVSVPVRAGDNEQTFTFNGSASSLFSITSSANGGNFTSGNLYSTASLTARVVDANGSPVTGATVTWSVVSTQNNSQAMMPGWKSKKTGLTWGNVPESGLDYATLAQERIVSATNNTSTTDSNGETAMQLTDIVGERIITVKAEVTVSGTTYSARQDVSFGEGPLSKFTAPAEYLDSSSLLTFGQAYDLCNGSGKYVNDGVVPSTWTSGSYIGGGKMPTVAEMQAVSPPSAFNNNADAQGAAYAAGWASGSYRWWWWTGEAYGADLAFPVHLFDGYDNYGGYVGLNAPVACRR
jgi:hypothetical protein